MSRFHEEAASRAAKILNDAATDPISHPYAIRKSVPLGPLVKRGAWPQRGWEAALLIPIYGSDGKLWTLEAISEAGEKDFLRGGKKRGCFHPFGNLRGATRILIGEGIATVAACVEATGIPAIAAMDAGNLEHAACSLRDIAASAELVFLADNDVKPDGSNPGIKAATTAARALGARLAIPELDGRKCDFWICGMNAALKACNTRLRMRQSPSTEQLSRPIIARPFQSGSTSQTMTCRG
jgi:putative DNA primase/helicase